MKPVLAKLTNTADPNKHSWYEIIYYDGNNNWRTYQFGSNTFDSTDDVVLQWKYCDEVLDYE